MEHFGPLAQLAGEWEGSKGLDVSFHYADDQVGDTPYREIISFKPFGPVDNGAQNLFGLDYKMAAWREGEDDPFHTEVGYWLWCSQLGHVMRGFVIPRGSVILAGGEAAPDATEFTYDETSVLEMAELDEPLDHTDRNTLELVQRYELPLPPEADPHSNLLPISSSSSIIWVGASGACGPGS